MIADAMGDEDDVTLLDAWKAGDKAAGSRLFRRHLPAMHRFFSTKVEPDAIEELVQDTFLACLRSRDRFRGDSSFRTFLFGIARLELLAHWRNRRHREIPTDFDEISVAALSTSVGTRLVRREGRLRMLDALRELPLEQQVLLELTYWEQLDGAALAAIFDVEPATIRSRLFRAREALRARLEQLDAIGGRAADDVDGWARALRDESVARAAVAEPTKR
jgi:RNA polymerase sigma-70 factor (ECF subfamily)